MLVPSKLTKLISLSTHLCFPVHVLIPNSTSDSSSALVAKQSIDIQFEILKNKFCNLFIDKFSNRVHALVSEKTAAHLPICEIHPGRSLHAILKKFMTVIKFEFILLQFKYIFFV